MTWKPSPREGMDHLPLSALQGYLLSRLDGSQDLPALAALMNLDEGQVAAMLQELVSLGAVAPAGSPLPHGLGTGRESQPPLEAVDGAEEDASSEAARSTTHRQLFEAQLHPQPVEVRVAQARLAQEPALSAYCFDPTTEVIRALLENPLLGGQQARLIAAHHRTAAGLEALGARAAFAHDPGVRRALLQNPLLPPSLYRRLWSSRRLLEQYLVASTRDAPEQVRAMARDLLRTSFNQRAGEERAELILTTEGRCLVSLVGLTLDGQATALLCRRTYVSTLLIQNIARWSAAPPALIAHLRRQEAVKRNPALRLLLERHPNASG